MSNCLLNCPFEYKLKVDPNESFNINTKNSWILRFGFKIIEGGFFSFMILTFIGGGAKIYLQKVGKRYKLLKILSRKDFQLRIWYVHLWCTGVHNDYNELLVCTCMHAHVYALNFTPVDNICFVFSHVHMCLKS